MTYAASIALMSAGIACYVAALSVQFARAPGWRDQRYFSLAAIAAAAFAALNVPTVAPVLSDRAVVFSTRIQFVLVALHVFAWLRYSSIVVGRAASRVDRYLVWILAAIAAGAALPDAYFTGGIRVDSIASIGYSYRSPVATPLGDAAYVVAFSFVLVPTARFARAWRRGLPNAGVQFLALVFLLVLGVNDLLVMSDVYQGPYLSDIAFLLPIAAVGYVLTTRFVEDSRAHQALRRDLEHQVAERTAELGQAQAALHRAEKLAALGQFAAGVAHEVNNPACVVSANLSYIDQMESDVLTSARRVAPGAQAHRAAAARGRRNLRGACAVRQARPVDERHRGERPRVRARGRARAGGGEPGRERGPGHPGSPVRRERLDPERDDRRSRHPGRGGRRRRDGARGPAARLRAVLHDEAVRERHGPRARGLPRPRHEPRRRPPPREQPRRRHAGLRGPGAGRASHAGPGAARGAQSRGAGPHPDRGRRGRRPHVDPPAPRAAVPHRARDRRRRGALAPRPGDLRPRALRRHDARRRRRAAIPDAPRPRSCGRAARRVLHGRRGDRRGARVPGQPAAARAVQAARSRAVRAGRRADVPRLARRRPGRESLTPSGSGRTSTATRRSPLGRCGRSTAATTAGPDASPRRSRP